MFAILHILLYAFKTLFWEGMLSCQSKEPNYIETFTEIKLYMHIFTYINTHMHNYSGLRSEVLGVGNLGFNPSSASFPVTLDKSH